KPWHKRATRYNDDKFYEYEIDWQMKEKRTGKINNVPDAALSSVELKRLFDTYDVEILEFEETFYFKVDYPELGRIRKHIVEWENKKVKDRKSTRLNSSHVSISYAVFCLKKKNQIKHRGSRVVSSLRARSRTEVVRVGWHGTRPARFGMICVSSAY